jgi:uncharacterized membrane protein
MEPWAAMCVVSFLDPVRAMITFGCTFLSRKHGILIAALASSIVCESILTAAQGWRYWGHGMLAGFVASLLQAVLLVYAVKVMRRRRVERHAD